MLTDVEKTLVSSISVKAVSIGTISIPPPVPNSPLIAPAAKPATAILNLSNNITAS